MKGQRAGWIASLAMVALSACAATHEGGMGPRQGNCDGQPGSTAIITIDMTQPGSFSVSPKVCGGKGGKPFVWTTTSNPPATFTVRFTGATPDPRGRTEFTGERATDNKPYTTRVARPVGHNPGGNNTYDYVVIVDGVEIDPSLIIYPN